MLRFALIGAGRIGKMHANHIASNDKCVLEVVYDLNTKASKEIANKHNCNIAKSAKEAILNKNIDVVYITSATSTHIEYILLAAKSGKPIFCEKPVDLDILKVDKCRKELKKYNVPIHIGFNRRFDLSHKSAKEAKDSGEIGNLEMIIVTSRDPRPSTLSYHKYSGGMFKDMTIHDFDLACFILGNDPIIEISVYGGNLFSSTIKKINDLDTAMIIMKSKSGVLCHINNSRHAAYGYDQRLEIFGSKGMVISNNKSSSSIKKYNKNFTNANYPFYDFFIERYEQAYKDQLENFAQCLINHKPTSVNFEDGRNALIIANAAYKALSLNKSIKIKYN